jgi:hypothetical protein
MPTSSGAWAAIPLDLIAHVTHYCTTTSVLALASVCAQWLNGVLRPHARIMDRVEVTNDNVKLLVASRLKGHLRRIALSPYIDVHVCSLISESFPRVTEWSLALTCKGAAHTFELPAATQTLNISEHGYTWGSHPSDVLRRAVELPELREVRYRVLEDEVDIGSLRHLEHCQQLRTLDIHIADCKHYQPARLPEDSPLEGIRMLAQLTALNLRVYHEADLQVLFAPGHAISADCRVSVEFEKDLDFHAANEAFAQSLLAIPFLTSLHMDNRTCSLDFLPRLIHLNTLSISSSCVGLPGLLPLSRCSSLTTLRLRINSHTNPDMEDCEDEDECENDECDGGARCEATAYHEGMDDRYQSRLRAVLRGLQHLSRLEIWNSDMPRSLAFLDQPHLHARLHSLVITNATRALHRHEAHYIHSLRALQHLCVVDVFRGLHGMPPKRSPTPFTPWDRAPKLTYRPGERIRVWPRYRCSNYTQCGHILHNAFGPDSTCEACGGSVSDYSVDPTSTEHGFAPA